MNNELNPNSSDKVNNGRDKSDEGSRSPLILSDSDIQERNKRQQKNPLPNKGEMIHTKSEMDFQAQSYIHDSSSGKLSELNKELNNIEMKLKNDLYININSGESSIEEQGHQEQDETKSYVSLVDEYGMQDGAYTQENQKRNTKDDEFEERIEAILNMTKQRMSSTM